MQYDILPFVDALSRTFRDMAEIEIGIGPVEEPDGTIVFSDATATIGLMGTERASLVMTVEEPLALEITQRVTGKAAGLEDRLVGDTIGELLNMVVGAAQRGSPVKFDFSLPVSIRGKNHEVRAVSKGYFRRVLCSAAGGKVGLYLARTPVTDQ
jgi:CheY-specific phosphatase CheX